MWIQIDLELAIERAIVANARAISEEPVTADAGARADAGRAAAKTKAR
jgi:hypothetical protein